MMPIGKMRMGRDYQTNPCLWCNSQTHTSSHPLSAIGVKDIKPAAHRHTCANQREKHTSNNSNKHPLEHLQEYPKQIPKI
jgi:hypothetical protein